MPIADQSLPALVQNDKCMTIVQTILRTFFMVKDGVAQKPLIFQRRLNQNLIL